MKTKVDLKDPVKAAVTNVLSTLVPGIEFTDSPDDAKLVVMGDIRYALKPLKAGKYVALLLIPRDLSSAFGLTSAPLYAGRVEAYSIGQLEHLAVWVGKLQKENQ